MSIRFTAKVAVKGISSSGFEFTDGVIESILRDSVGVSVIDGLGGDVVGRVDSVKLESDAVFISGTLIPDEDLPLDKAPSVWCMPGIEIEPQSRKYIGIYHYVFIKNPTAEKHSDVVFWANASIARNE